MNRATRYSSCSGSGPQTSTNGPITSSKTRASTSLGGEVAHQGRDAECPERPAIDTAALRGDIMQMRQERPDLLA